MKTVCAQIEEKVLGVLRALVGDRALVVGFRESAASGTVKSVSGGRPEVRVTVSPGVAESYSSPIMEYHVKVAVNLDLEDDPTQSLFDEISAEVEVVVEAWNKNANRESTSTVLSTSDFMVNGFRADGGTDTLDLSRDNPRICTVYAFAVKGVITR